MNLDNKISSNDRVLTDIQHQNKTKEKLQNYAKIFDHDMEDMREVKRGMLSQIDSQNKAKTEIQERPDVIEKVENFTKMEKSEKKRFRKLR